MTPSELRIATLASEGRSNKAIAQELFVSLKTVEKRLANAYDKLGVRSRPALATALEQPDDDGRPRADAAGRATERRTRG